jgi:twitching motility protein PilT
MKKKSGECSVSNTAAGSIEEYHEFYMNRLFRIIDACGALGVSDVHFLPDDGIYTVTQGVLAKDPSPNAVIPQQEILEWLRQPGQEGEATGDILGEKGHVSLAFNTGTFRLRGSFRRTTGGVSVTFRLIPRGVPDADSVGVPQVIQSLISNTAGLILIEGPTGSGKTTAIAGLINKINRETDQHVYLIEDPVEFVHEPLGNTVFTQREIGDHASDFPTAVENALRSKPNVIVVGELLNPATAKAALHAASTGHLVITTAHAGSVTEAIASFIGQFTADEQPQIRSRLSQSLLAIMVQKLVPKIGGGLTAAREVLINNRNFQEIILDESKLNMIHQQMQSAPGSNSLEDDLIRLVRDGIVSPEVALMQARNQEAVQDGLIRLGLHR